MTTTAVDTLIIDAHVHLPVSGGTDTAADAALRVMDANGITGAVISPAPGYETPRGVSDSAAQNDAIADAVRRWPDRFLAGLGVVEPRHGQAAQPEAHRAVHDLGLRGLMFDSDINGQPIDSPAVLALIEQIADRTDAIVQFHTSPYSVLRSGFRLAKVANTFPDLRFINGTALTDTTHEAATLEVALRCPNVYIDLAFARSHLYTIENVVGSLSPDRILFGSGNPNITTALQINLVRLARIPDDAKRHILGLSTLRLFGLTTP